MNLTMKFLALFFGMLALTNIANADSPREQLQQLLTQLQQSQNDQALREKIISLALTLNPKPATPDATTMAEGAAEYAFRNAKTNSDFSDAANQYEKALLLAPWLADDYYNCGIAHEKAGENKDAIRNFTLYLLAAPNASDVVAIKKRIGGLQYVEKKAEDEAANRPTKKEPVTVPPVMQRFVCQPSDVRAAGKEAFSFDFSTRIVTSRVVLRDGGDGGASGQPVSFQEAGSRLIWTTPPPDSSVSTGFRQSLDRDSGILDTTDPFGRLWPRTYQCGMSQR